MFNSLLSIFKTINKSNNISFNSSKLIFLNAALSLSSYLMSYFFTSFLNLSFNPLQIILIHQAVLGFIQTFISLTYATQLIDVNTMCQIDYKINIYEFLFFIILFYFFPTFSLTIYTCRVATYIMVLILQGKSNKIALVNILLSVSTVFEVLTSVYFKTPGISLLVFNFICILILEQYFNLRSLINFKIFIHNFKKFNILTFFNAIIFSFISFFNTLLPTLVGLPILYSQIVSFSDRITFFLQRLLQSSIIYEGSISRINKRTFYNSLVNLCFFYSFLPFFYFLFYLTLNESFLLNFTFAFLLLTIGYLRLEFSYYFYIYTRRLPLFASSIMSVLTPIFYLIFYSAAILLLFYNLDISSPIYSLLFILVVWILNYSFSYNSIRRSDQNIFL